jgi:hypothetical protein
MINERIIKMYDTEMVGHVAGAAQFLGSLLGGRYVTTEQTREAIDFLMAKTKRDIESCPYASQEEMDTEIHRRELLMNLLKSQMGL